MQRAIRFAGTCPTCGRSLHIPIELYGKQVCCHGCGAEFRASGKNEAPSTFPAFDAKSITHRSNLDSRVETLLAAADRQLDQACLHPYS